MRKLKVAFYICFLVSLTMFGYNNGEEVAKAKSGETVKQQVKADAQVSKKEDSPKEKTFDLAFIKEKIEIGQNQKQVKVLLGNKYVGITSAMDGTEMWRYDIGASKDYQFEGFLDEVDLQGLKDGALKIQLFISWNSQGQVQHISAYYLDENDQLLHEYMKFATGEARDMAIEYN